MAKATFVKAKPVKQPPNKVILELSEGEADFILALTSAIAGDTSRSPRKYNGRISQALQDALGFDWSGTDAYRPLGGSIRFRNYPE